MTVASSKSNANDAKSQVSIFVNGKKSSVKYNNLDEDEEDRRNICCKINGLFSCLSGWQKICLIVTIVLILLIIAAMIISITYGVRASKIKELCDEIDSCGIIGFCRGKMDRAFEELRKLNATPSELRHICGEDSRAYQWGL